MGFALRDFRFTAIRRVLALWAAAGVTVIVALGIVIESTKYGVPPPVIPLVIAVPAWLAFTKRTNLALVIVILYIGLLDGFIHLTTAGNMATLVRDVILYSVAIGMVLRTRGPCRLPPLGAWVIAWTVVFVVQIANPGGISTFHSVASLRQDLEFVPLFFIGYVALRSHASLHTFFALLLLIAAINGVVGAYQSSLTPSQLSTWGPGYAQMERADVFVGSNGTPRVRPPALGQDEGFGGFLGAVALPGGVVLLIAYRRRRWLSLLIALGIVGAAIGVLTSEQREAVVMAVVGLFTALALIAVGRQARRALIGLLVVLTVSFVAVELIGSYNSSALSRYSSIAPNSAGATIYESRANTWSLFSAYAKQIPLGAGLGRVGPAASKAGVSTGGNAAGEGTGWNAESEFNFLVVEAGLPAFLVFLGFQAALASAVLRGLRRERDPHTVALMAGLAAPLLACFAGAFFGVTTSEPPAAPYLWLAAGIVSWWLVNRHRVCDDRVAPTQRPSRRTNTWQHRLGKVQPE